MVIGFSKRYTFVNEGDVLPGSEDFPVDLIVHSLISSERLTRVLFRLQLGSSNATVDTMVTSLDIDATFGARQNQNNPDSPIGHETFIDPGNLVVRDVVSVRVVNDFHAEPLECLTIRILSPDIDGERDIFDCYEDGENSIDFFCLHTICIKDDDG